MSSNQSSISAHNNFHILQYNLHGLNQGSPLLDHFCQVVCPSVLFLSEHWQTPANLHKILNFSKDYTGFGISAMATAVQKSVLRGRPWGGCAILIRNHLVAAVKIILITDRIVIVSLGQFILVNVYLPCLSLSSFETISGILDEISGALEGLPHHYLIFGGDLNCNVHENSAVSTMLHEFLGVHQLTLCDQNINEKDRITYHHESLNHKSYIDFLFISKTLHPNLNDYSILDHALNHSDHYAVSLSVSYSKNILDVDELLSRQQSSNSTGQSTMTAHLRWDQANLANYYDETFRTLDPLRTRLQLSFEQWSATSSHYNDYAYELGSGQGNECNDISRAAVAHIEDCYAELTNGLNSAASALVPRLQPNALKFWWSQEANDLKSKSILSHKEWQNNNKPRIGPIQHPRSYEK